MRLRRLRPLRLLSLTLWPQRSRRLLLLLLLAAALAPSCGGESSAPAPAPSADGWHEFSGSWSAAGRRRQLDFGEGRRVALVEVSGSLMLGGPNRPARGFHGEAITFADSGTGLVGRAVWTDEHGDQVYSELEAAQVQPGVRITGRIVGGTGRFQGATGEYGFEWQYLIEAEDGRIQGRTAGLAGRVRVGPEEAPR